MMKACQAYNETLERLALFRIVSLMQQFGNEWHIRVFQLDKQDPQPIELQSYKDIGELHRYMAYLVSLYR